MNAAARELVRVDLTDAELAFARRLGAMRNGTHVANGNSSRRFFADENEENVKGCIAEVAFSKASGLPIDEALYADGDGGIDFRAKIGERLVTVDVKGATKPAYLLVKTKEIERRADVYVLAGLSGRAVFLLGWESRRVMMTMPTRDFGYGILSHYRAQHELRDMRRLLDRVLPNWDWILDYVRAEEAAVGRRPDALR